MNHTTEGLCLFVIVWLHSQQRLVENDYFFRIQGLLGLYKMSLWIYTVTFLQAENKLSQQHQEYFNEH